MNGSASSHAPRLASIFDGKKDERLPRSAAYGLAAMAHVAIAYASTTLPAPRPVPEPQVTEVEIAPPPAEPEPPPPPPAEPEPPPEPEAAAARAPAAAPVAARAGNVLTAKADAPNAPSEEVVDFVTDPNGTSFGSGVVARGGTADHAAGHARPAPAAAKASAPERGGGGDAITPAADLGRPARLEESDPCAGRYPSYAKTDDGHATIALVVHANGKVASATIVSESPAGEGFGRAARECLLAKSFTPARSKAGDVVNAAVTVRVKFSR